MDPLILHPSKDRLKVAMMGAIAMLGLPVLLRLTGLGGLIPAFPTLAMFAIVGGGVLILNIVKAERNAVPIFAGDAYGFSIRGGRKLGWDQFKGADTLPFNTAIKIGTGDSSLRPNVEIKTLELSGPAREMVAQIEEYAALARRSAVMGGAVTLGGGRGAHADAMPPTLEQVSGFGAGSGAGAAATPAQAVHQPTMQTAALGEPDVGLLPIELFPSEMNRLKGIALGAVLLLFAYKMAGTAESEAVWVVWLFGLLGGFGFLASAWSYVRPKASFAADMDGFSIRGKRKKSWNEFRSVSVHTVSYWFIPVSRDVVVKTGKSMIGGRKHVPFYLMSGSAKEMAAEISQYVRAVQVAKQRGTDDVMQRAEALMTRAPRQVVKAEVELPHANAPTTPPIIDVNRPTGDSFMTRLQESGAPVSSVPTLSERIFGKRKVF